MDKVTEYNLQDILDHILMQAKKEGLFHFYAKDEILNGRKIVYQGKELFHFGRSGYLGLDRDERVKKAAVESIIKFGTQFQWTKLQSSHHRLEELEELLSQMFKNNVIVTKNSTFAHILAISQIIDEKDTIILDEQVNGGIYAAMYWLRLKKNNVIQLRHNDLNMLEETIKKNTAGTKRIFYFTNSLFLNTGEVVPLQNLLALAHKYQNLYIYVDDVLGISWTGSNGTGFVNQQIPQLHPQMILISTLGQSFGASGGIVVIPDSRIMEKMRSFTWPICFEAQLEPAALGAAIASAQIHLTDEIYQLQNELTNNIEHCNCLIQKTSLSIQNLQKSPFYLLKLEKAEQQSELIQHLLQQNFFINGSLSQHLDDQPGICFTISRHNQPKDIEGLIDCIDTYYFNIRQKNDALANKIKSFQPPRIEESLLQVPKDYSGLSLNYYNTIKKFEAQVWDKHMGLDGFYDYKGMVCLENSFQEIEMQNNWKFHYFEVYDNDKLVLLTFFTSSLWKDDMFSAKNKSKKNELIRIVDPLHLTSKVLSMGCLATEGNHLYLNRDHPRWKDALRMIIKMLKEIQEHDQSEMIVLRDIIGNDPVINDFFESEGFSPIYQPDTCELKLQRFSNAEAFLNLLPGKSRKAIKKDVIRNLKLYEAEIKSQLSEQEIHQLYELHLDMVTNSLDINIFPYPAKIIREFARVTNARFLILRKKSSQRIVGFCAFYINSLNHFITVFCGLHHRYARSHKVHGQLLFHLVYQANEFKCSRVYLGHSNILEKEKLGASIIPVKAFVQHRDNYDLARETASFTEKLK
ncbi:MAG: aminotransferase class I/II-fold pyridoxal phosphate-dependent enzyme [Candidatus Cyclobacteriaceae bacterium M3_2C_046]